MKKSTTCIALSFGLAATALANPPADSGSVATRHDPEVAEALRNASWAAGPHADAFQQALHLEEVARDLDKAAAEYQTLVDKHRARNDDRMAGIASLALFRMAEIRRKQGREEEGRKLYGQVAAQFQNWEPMASLSRQQLGLDPSDFKPQVTKIENDRALNDYVERSLWKIQTRRCEDKFVLVTFKVEPDPKNPYENMPKAQEVQTLHYLPDGRLTGTVSTTCVKGDPVKVGKILGKRVRGTLGTRVTGFGHSYDVPAGLRRYMAISLADSDWIGYRASSFDAKVSYVFHDEMDEKSKELSVSFTLVTIPEAEARKLAESRSINLLEMAEQAWSITMPPSPDEFTKAHREE